MANDEEFRKQAAEAQRMADRAVSPLDKESWLRIAQSWMNLIRKPVPTASESLDADTAKRGIGQDESGSSH